ncbi:MAG: hypothetical protein HQL03_04965 [Nitrospirae bacterium]|nr:hypothetical protein [Nitrospirota bacterium]
MSTAIEQEHSIGLIRITQYVTDNEGLRIAAIVDIEELRGSNTINRGCQDLSHFYTFIIWRCYYAAAM